ncbi:MAG: Nif3-like dinuclear metal center hexameric protein, partial [Thermomicrobiaceae bacterium]|nr:Nif3-like dinuclear metal center hexameric protein [Thermomicrobiaceae bacterium]
MARIERVLSFANEYLAVDRFRDAAVNGLQVEGRAELARLATAVSASQRTIEDAIAAGADALLVHHGVLWGERRGPIAGVFAARLRLLLRHDLALIAYHLPLDAHPEVGNNALLARALGLGVVEPFAEVAGQPIGVIAEPESPLAPEEIARRVREVTGREPVTLPGGPDAVHRVGIVSGSGYS